jgi:CBS domain-containing protein
MQAAIDSRDFVLAGKIDEKITKLERDLQEEIEKQGPEVVCPEKQAAAQISAVPTKPTTIMSAKAPLVRSKSIARTVDSVSVKSATPTKTNRSSVVSARQPGADTSIAASAVPKAKSHSEKTVSALRPAKPVIVECGKSIFEISKILAEKRSDCMLLTSTDGNDLIGIVTSTDITRRLVAKGLSPSVTTASDIMTANPTVVTVNDSAMDALTLMIEHRFRHLPVVDEEGSIAGVIDVAKCLDAAITKLEKVQNSGSSSSNLLIQNLLSQKSVSASDARALSKLLESVMQQAFGGASSPTLRSLLAGKPMTITSPQSSVYEASQLMMEHRKATLVVEDNKIVGIFSFKDMMKRIVAVGLPSSTPVSSVMTKSPYHCDPDITVIEALEIMHDSKFLSLPVCEKDGTVVGLVDVLDVMYGSGGTQGWRAVFASVLDENDENGSVASQAKSDFSSKGLVPPQREKPVSKLRPPKPVIIEAHNSITLATQLLKQKRSSAALITNNMGALEGIITDTDITRRGKLSWSLASLSNMPLFGTVWEVVAKHVDPNSNTIGSVMTANPKCVSVNDPAIDALITMIENHFRTYYVCADLRFINTQSTVRSLRPSTCCGREWMRGWYP